MEGPQTPSDAETVADIIAQLLVSRGYTSIPIDEFLDNRLKIFKLGSNATRVVIWVNTNYHSEYVRIHVHYSQPTDIDIIDRNLFGRVTINIADPNAFDKFNELITRSELGTK